MKKIIRYTLVVSLLMGIELMVMAQEDSLSPEFKKTTISSLSKLMNDYYVFPEVAEKTSAHLKKQLEAGYFDSFKTLESFGEALTEEVQSINKDKHMRIRPSRPMEAKENSIERFFEEHQYRMTYNRNNAGGFKEAKKLEGNVGYFEIRSFDHPATGIKYADSYMQLLATSDAIIIDLRKNGGGSPAMVQYLCSYFFDKKVHLNSLYYREGDRTDEYWTLEEVEGERMPDIPLFVLTSERTFSGAEEFSYNMQTQKRATLVGATTGGGANPGRGMLINEQLEVFIPTGKAINPITKTNWEGVGVIPDVKTDPEEALDKAYELAKVAAENYRDEVKEKHERLFDELVKVLNAHDGSEAGEKSIFKNLKECEQAGLLGEGMINGLGYEYLMNHQQPKTAETIFKANSMLHPESANVYDSYAEALVMNGKLKEAAENYQKAVDIATVTNDFNLELFKENLKKVKDQMD